MYFRETVASWLTQSGSASCQSRSTLACRRPRFQSRCALFLPPWPPPWRTCPSGTSTLFFRCRLKRNILILVWDKPDRHDILMQKCEKDDKNAIGNCNASWATDSTHKTHIKSTCTTNLVPHLKMTRQAFKQTTIVCSLLGWQGGRSYMLAGTINNRVHAYNVVILSG